MVSVCAHLMGHLIVLSGHLVLVPGSESSALGISVASDLFCEAYALLSLESAQESLLDVHRCAKPRRTRRYCHSG
jgi:hypothetical protein